MQADSQQTNKLHIKERDNSLSTPGRSPIYPSKNETTAKQSTFYPRSKQPSNQLIIRHTLINDVSKTNERTNQLQELTRQQSTNQSVNQPTNQPTDRPTN